MNTLLDQFLAEASDLLAQVDEGLLGLEREPHATELINEVFRAAHTLKGSSGLFDFPELTRLAHAAEDLLDAARAQRVELDSAMIDDLLVAFDLIRGWLANVTAHGRLPTTAGTDTTRVSCRLREPLTPVAGAGEHPPAGTGQAPAGTSRHGTGIEVSAPRWLLQLDEEWLRSTAGWLATTDATLRFARYVPDDNCFFRGEDPLYLVRQVPALDRLAVVAPELWPETAEYDEYACLLGFVFATRAGTGEVAHLFRYVTDQVEIVEIGAAALDRLLAGAPDEQQPAGSQPDEDDEARALLGSVLRTLDAGAGDAEGSAGAVLASAVQTATAAALALGRPDVLPLPTTADGLRTAVAALLAAPPTPAGSTTGPDPAATTDPTTTTDPAMNPMSMTGGLDGGRVGAKTLKVDQNKIDTMMELVGELNVAKNGLTFLATAAEEEYGSRILSRRIKDQHAVLHRITEELQSAVMDVRMLPLSVAFRRVPRLLRDLSRKLGKSVELMTDGDDTTADKDIIEAIGDPLVHLVRNCVDHGIEAPHERVAAGKPAQAMIKLTAAPDNDAVVIEVSDDGRGIDPEMVRRKAWEKGLISAAELAQLADDEAANLVFLPGFSTAAEISEVSGRGVGMDAVRASVNQLGGSVSVRSRCGEGTVVQLRLPLSVAVTQVMVISVAGQRFGVPLDVIVESTRVTPENVSRTLHQDVLLLRDEVIPLVDLATALGMDRAGRPAADVLVVTTAGQKVGLLVERLHREADVLLKPMDGLLAEASVFSGTTLLGDGLVLLVLDVREVLRHDAGVA